MDEEEKDYNFGLKTLNYREKVVPFVTDISNLIPGMIEFIKLTKKSLNDFSSDLENSESTEKNCKIVSEQVKNEESDSTNQICIRNSSTNRFLNQNN